MLIPIRFSSALLKKAMSLLNVSTRMPKSAAALSARHGAKHADRYVKGPPIPLTAFTTWKRSSAATHRPVWQDFPSRKSFLKGF